VTAPRSVNLQEATSVRGKLPSNGCVELLAVGLYSGEPELARAAWSGKPARAVPDHPIVGRLHPSTRPECKQRIGRMAEHQITCVVTQNSQDRSSGITNLGNHRVGWIRTRQEIINNIRHRDIYYILEGGRRAELTIQGTSPHEFLQTVTDWSSPNNLGNLPTCPSGLRSG
jgi:hypothetical protein